MKNDATGALKKALHSQKMGFVDLGQSQGSGEKSGHPQEKWPSGRRVRGRLNPFAKSWASPDFFGNVVRGCPTLLMIGNNWATGVKINPRTC
jgi:hypothetical protein